MIFLARQRPIKYARIKLTDLRIETSLIFQLCFKNPSLVDPKNASLNAKS